MNNNALISRYLLIAAAFVIVIAGLRAANALAVPFLLATFFAIVLSPLMQVLRDKGLPASLSLIVIIVVCLGVSGSLSYLIGSSINQFRQSLADLPKRIETNLEPLREEWYADWLPIGRKIDDENEFQDLPEENESSEPEGGSKQEGIDSRQDTTPELNVPKNVESVNEDEPVTTDDPEPPLAEEETTSPEGEPFDEEAPDGGLLEGDPLADDPLADDPLADDPLADGFSDGQELTNPPRRSLREVPSSLAADLQQMTTRYFRDLLSGLANVLSNTFIILITVAFMLLEASRFPAKLRAALGDNNPVLSNIQQIVADVRRYMVIKSMTSALTGILVSTLLTVLEIPYPFLWGLLAVLFNFVPNIGSIIASIPAILLALISEDPVATATLVAVGYVIINCFISYAIEPRFMGQGLGLSTLVVFLSLVFWGWVLGPVGMLLSAPLTMIVKITLENSEDLKWLAVMMGSKAPEPEAGS